MNGKRLHLHYPFDCYQKLNTSLLHMHHFTPDSILEDEIFISRNLDWECDRVGQLLYEYGEKFIEPALKDDMYSLAVKRYLQMLDSLTVHYIQDEQRIYYDDLFFPDQVESHIWEQFVEHIRLGKLAGEDLKTLEDGLALIEQSEAYQNYCIPLGIPFKDLIGNVISTFRKRRCIAAACWALSLSVVESPSCLANDPFVAQVLSRKSLCPTEALDL